MSGPTVAFLARALDIGGAQRQLVELALGLHRYGWGITVVTFYDGGALEAPLREAGVSIRCLKKRGRWDVLGFAWRLLRLIRQERPCLVHGYLDLPNVLLAVLRPAFSTTRVVWGIAASNMDLSQYDWLARMEFRLGVLFSRCCDLIICNSEAGRGYHIQRGYSGRRVTVIPNGIDVNHFKSDAVARAAVRKEWCVEPHETLIGLVGRLDPMKDHANFLRAAARVAAARPEARFVCVGDGPNEYREGLIALAKDLQLGTRLRWAGERVDVSRVYNALDLAVSSSISEGLPNAIAEAMATGVPCVVTDVGDSAALVGELGWVCAPNDPDALSRAMMHALNALPCDSAAIRQRICTRYSSAALVEKTATELGRLIRDGVYTPEAERVPQVLTPPSRESVQVECRVGAAVAERAPCD